MICEDLVIYDRVYAFFDHLIEDFIQIVIFFETKQIGIKDTFCGEQNRV